MVFISACYPDTLGHRSMISFGDSGMESDTHTVYSGDGLLLTSVEDTVRQWKEYFKDLLSPTLVTEAEFGKEGTTHPWVGEINEVVKQQKFLC